MAASASNHTARLDAALDYAARGWPVLPCSPRDKRPLVPRDVVDGKPVAKSGGLSKASCDAQTVRDWWDRWPDALIGVATGVKAGIFVVDFDPRIDPETGEEFTLERLKAETEAQIGCPLPASLAVRTPSGGVHVYYRMPEGEPIRNRGSLPKHVDVRGEGGYVVAPPGVNSAGGAYRWLRGASDAPIADAPQALIEQLRPANATRPRKASKPHGSPAPVGDGGSAIESYALAALDAECAAIAKAGSGGRQDALNRAAFNVAQLVAAGALPEASARAAIEDAAASNPGRDSEAQLQATIASGWAAGLGQPRDLSHIDTRPLGRRLSRGARQSEANDNADDDDALHRRLCMLPQTDLGNAERFAARYGDRIRYVDKIGWHAHDGRRFIHDGAEALIGGWVTWRRWSACAFSAHRSPKRDRSWRRR